MMRWEDRLLVYYVLMFMSFFGFWLEGLGGFISTSLKETEARKFQGNTLIKIFMKEEAYEDERFALVSEYSSQKQEEEVLFIPFCHFKIIEL